jgi:plastocyanin
MKALALLSSILAFAPAAMAGEQIIAAAAHAPGVNGTFFRTDVRVVNLSNAKGTFELAWLPSNRDNSSPQSVVLELEARASRQLDDIVLTTFGVEGGGAIRVSSEAAFVATSRTYTTASDGCPGTFGQFIPAAATTDARIKSVLANIRLSAVSTSGFRSNVGLVNPAAQVVVPTLRLRDHSGALLATATVSLLPFSHSQSPVATLFQQTSLSDDNLYIEVDSPAAVIAYASVIDNASGDPVYVAAVADAATPLATVVVARQWEFEPAQIDAEIGRPITVVFRSVDIDHGVGISGVGAFTCSSEQGGQCVLRPGEDVVVTFTPRTAGSFAFYCTRFCGASSDNVHGHATMRGTVVVK